MEKTLAWLLFVLSAAAQLAWGWSDSLFPVPVLTCPVLLYCAAVTRERVR